MTRRTATVYRAEFWHDDHTDPSNPGWVLRITRDGETIHEGEALYAAADARDRDEVRDAIEREIADSYGPVNPQPVNDSRPDVEAFEWTDPVTCPACTKPIPDGEGVVVTFDGTGDPAETWHRDCAAAEQPQEV